MLSQLITALHNNNIEPTAEELADALWFAMQIKPVSTPTSEKIPQLPESIPLFDKPTQEVQPPEVVESEVAEPKAPILPKTTGTTGSNSGLPIRVPATTMLSDVLSLERALRPLARKVESRTKNILDEAATVQQIAELDIWIPILKGISESWFKVALVIDQSASMVIWQPTIMEFRNLLQRTFGQVNKFELKYKQDRLQQVQLYVGSRVCKPQELVDYSGRQLILVVSDCVSPAWYSGEITQLLELWGKFNPVAIINMLPQRMWTGSGLGEAMRVNLRATMPGLANAKLAVDEDWDELETGMKMPVVTLEPESLRFWASSLVGKAWISGVVFEPSRPLA